MKSVRRLLNELIQYAYDEHLLDTDDHEYVTNGLIHLFGMDAWIEEDVTDAIDFFALMAELLDHAVRQGLIEADVEPLRDNFEAKIMDIFLPRPSELNRHFTSLFRADPVAATEYFFHLSKATNYIKTERIKKNINYVYEGKYAPLEITINLSKPEKDPKLIALQNQHASEGYPKCALCMENVGYYGTLDKAPRSNHRVVSITLNGEVNAWGFQYSPYAYFNEHCIILRKEHIPMRVDATTFVELLDFVDQFPHYLIGSNAGLPIVGGSILAHYHFQGGVHPFPIEYARTLHSFRYKGTTVDLLDWPLAVVRISGHSRPQVLAAVNRLFEAWKTFAAPDLDILAESEGELHNTITPIVNVFDDDYMFYVVLRNNRTTPERPYGLFHPREEWFHIKKENIGLIEVMGLAVLPGRLKSELDLIKHCLIDNEDPRVYPELEKHLPWIASLAADFGKTDPDVRLQDEVGAVFEKVLEDCGVFKAEAPDRFIAFVNATFGRK
ncbi:MAG: UDP-glucose--hexose-1-phosphate uridylyltransferase [bacterium]